MLRTIAIALLIAAVCVASAAVLSRSEPERVLGRLRERIYAYPVVVQGQLGDGYKTGNFRDLSGQIGQPLVARGGHLPLDSAFSDAIQAYSRLELDSDARRNAARELGLRELSIDLRSRLREVASARLTPMQKALEQRMYWDVHESMLLLQDQPEAHAAEVIQGLASLIYALRLTHQEIDTLRYDERELLARIFSDQRRSLAAPIVIDVSNRRATSVHAITVGGRSCFEGRAVLGEPAPGEADHLHRWREKRVLEQQVLNQELDAQEWFKSPLPDQPPSGTAFVLFRYLIVIDENNSPRRLPIVESAAVRFFSRSEDASSRETYALYELDQQASIAANTWQHASVGSDEIVWSGLLNGRPDRISAQGLALITTMSNNCAFCHNFAAPGPGQAIAFTVGRPSVAIEDASPQCELVLRHLTQTAGYIELRRQLRLEENGR